MVSLYHICTNAFEIFFIRQWVGYNITFYLFYRGLGIETVLLNLLKVYSDPGNLVIVLGTTSKEEEYYISELSKQAVKPVPKVITTEYNATERYYF